MQYGPKKEKKRNNYCYYGKYIMKKLIKILINIKWWIIIILVYGFALYLMLSGIGTS